MIHKGILICISVHLLHKFAAVKQCSAPCDLMVMRSVSLESYYYINKAQKLNVIHNEYNNTCTCVIVYNVFNLRVLFLINTGQNLSY